MQSYGVLEQLAVHNAFTLKDEDLAELKALGRIAAVVMPNSLHGAELGWMAERLPEVMIFVPAANRTQVEKRHRLQGTLENDWPNDFKSPIERKLMAWNRVGVGFGP